MNEEEGAVLSPGPELYAVVRAELLRKGLTLARWARENAYLGAGEDPRLSFSAVRNALFGTSNSHQARKIREALLADVGLASTDEKKEEQDGHRDH